MDETVQRPLLPLLHWGDAPVSELRQGPGGFVLPVGTVTLLLADVEGSTRRWEAQPGAMTEAVAHLDAVVAEAIGAAGGVRPVEQGEGDSFVAAFARASDALGCALTLQRAELNPIRLRIGIHTGEVQLRDEGNYIGSTVNRCARLRDLAHGAQTVLSGTTANLVADHLPEGAWLVDLGTHRLRDLARPEHVHQLCAPDLVVEFPALRSLDAYPHNLPVQLSSFVGRVGELAELASLLERSRLVTLTGSGGAGKTRLGLQVAAESLGSHPDGAWLVELAPVSDPDFVASAVAAALGLADQPARTPTETLLHHLAAKDLLLVLDNCEQVIGAAAALVETLLVACPSLVVLATSREPLGVSGELSWRIPSLSLPDTGGPTPIDGISTSEAVALFVERARQARAGFVLSETNAAAVAEICRRLDGIPLGIELAAARIKVLGADQIAAGLEDRFRLLTGGARTAVPRQQTLRASVEWSHELLTEPEQILFRRLGVFVASFDLSAAKAAGAGAGLEAHQVLDQLASLVDKSLVLADDADTEARYRLLETVRSYASERLEDSGEADAVHRRHRDHYLAFAEHAAAAGRQFDNELWVDRLEAELDNLRAAFWWSKQEREAEKALRIVTALFDLWQERGHVREYGVWFDEALASDATVPPALLVRALALRAFVEGFTPGLGGGHAEEALALARELGDPLVIAEALLGAGGALLWFGEASSPYFLECAERAREIGDSWLLQKALSGLGVIALIAGDPVRIRQAAAEGTAVAQLTRSAWGTRNFGWLAGTQLMMEGDLAAACHILRDTRPAAQNAGDFFCLWLGAAFEALAMIMVGDVNAARSACAASIAAAGDTGIPIFEFLGRGILGIIELATGDVAAAQQALAEVCDLTAGLPGYAATFGGFLAETELCIGDLSAARRHADDAVARQTASNAGWWRGSSLLASARVAVAEGDSMRAEELAHQALQARFGIGDKVGVTDTLETLAAQAADEGSSDQGARLLAAADSLRQAIGSVRFAIYRDSYASSVAELREAMGDERFEQVWAEGAALSLEEAVAYATRGRGERKRPSVGWASLTPAELDVVRLVAEGLANKQIAQRLFVSPRTVQTHLTHIYTKLDIGSRTQLTKEAGRRG